MRSMEGPAAPSFAELNVDHLVAHPRWPQLAALLPLKAFQLVASAVHMIPGDRANYNYFKFQLLDFFQSYLLNTYCRTQIQNITMNDQGIFGLC